MTPIKDVKTMIQAFGFAKEKDDRLKLWIMGPWEEDREYAEECFQLVSDMEIPDVVFTGRINIRDYLGRMDVTILTSISEGHPLPIRLEMGETGYRRVMEKYRVEYMQKTYWEIYRDFAEQMGLEWKEESVKLPDKEK